MATLLNTNQYDGANFAAVLPVEVTILATAATLSDEDIRAILGHTC